MMISLAPECYFFIKELLQILCPDDMLIWLFFAVNMITMHAHKFQIRKNLVTHKNVVHPLNPQYPLPSGSI
jgi:hypothetical protein